MIRPPDSPCSLRDCGRVHPGGEPPLAANLRDGKVGASHDAARSLLAGGRRLNGSSAALSYNADLGKLRSTGVPKSDIEDALDAIPGKTIFFIDTCHAGKILGEQRRGRADLNGLINELSSTGRQAPVSSIPHTVPDFPIAVKVN
jgi:hypothetical protein